MQETFNAGGFNPWVEQIPWRMKGLPTPVFLSGKSHGQRRLVGYSSWGHKESDMSQRLNNNNNNSSIGYKICLYHIFPISFLHQEKILIHHSPYPKEKRLMPCKERIVLTGCLCQIFTISFPLPLTAKKKESFSTTFAHCHLVQESFSKE